MQPMSALRPAPHLQELTDEKLMEVLVAGDRSAFDVLVHRHKARLYSYLLRLMRDPTDAEEVAQEAFVRAYVHADKYRNIAKFTTWLYTIATNLVRNRIRKTRSMPKLLSLQWGHGEEDESDRPGRLVGPPSGSGPLERRDREERRHQGGNGREREHHRPARLPSGPRRTAPGIPRRRAG